MRLGHALYDANVNSRRFSASIFGSLKYLSDIAQNFNPRVDIIFGGRCRLRSPMVSGLIPSVLLRSSS
jgi:hypothetical protein